MAGTQPKPIVYTFDADTKKFSAGARKVEGDLKGIDRQAAITDQALDMEATVDMSSLDILRARLLEAKSRLEDQIRIDVELDPTQALNDMRRIERQLRALDRMDANPEVHIDRDGNAGRVLGGISGSITDMMGKIPGLSGSLGTMAGSLEAIGVSGAAAGPALAGVAAGVALLAAAIGPGVVGGLSAIAGGVAFKGLLEAYDTLDKANRKAKIVFGKNIKDVEKWARDLSTNVGKGEKEIIAGAAAIQDLLVPQGFSRSDATAITEEIYERGAAIAEFSGFEIEEGVDAVTNALLGSRKQLKGMGVDIRASDINDWLKENADAVEGLNEKQAQTVATLALIEAGSKDAMTAFIEGGSEADSILDTLNGTLANLKTDAIEGFGGILVGILGDMKALGGFEFGGIKDLGTWIEENEEQIRRFFLDVVEYIGNAAIAAFDLGIGIAKTFVETAPMLADMIRAFGQMAANAQIVAGAILLANPLTFTFGKNLIESSGATRDMANSAADAYEGFAKTFGPDMISSMEFARDQIQGVVDTAEELEAMDEIRIQLTAAMEAGDKATVEAELDKLTSDQLAVISANLDPENEAEAELKALVDKEYTSTVQVETKLLEDAKNDVSEALAKLVKTRDAHIKAEATGLDDADDDLDRVANKDRTAYISIAVANAARALGDIFGSRSVESSIGINPLAIPTPTVAGGFDSAGVTYAPQIVNNYPKPERASDSIASSLRIARYMAGV